MSNEARFANIALKELTPNEYNARRFEENMTPQRRARFAELVESVRGKGVIEPLLVRPLASGNFEVIAGERRYRAALQAELSEVPCMVREVDDDAAFDLMVIENLQREDLSPLETAQAFKAYLGRYGSTPESVAEISARTGIPTHAIRRQVRMLELPAEVLTAWRDGALTQSHVEMFTRVADSAQILELLTACLRSKLTVRELGERIGAICPELERGFFDKADCQVCMHNTAVQSGLFADVTPGGKCSNSNCFEVKQSAFLEANWLQSKAHAQIGTRGFRFGHRLGNEHREPIIGKETAQRCLQCDLFVSVLRLTGAVVSGYERTCIGPRNCFEELYLAPQVSPTPEPEKVVASPPVENPVGKKQETPEKVVQSPGKVSFPPPVAKRQTAPPAKSKPVDTPDAPVFNAPRGEKYRQSFLKERLEKAVKQATFDDTRITGLALLALASVSLPARKVVDSLLDLGNNSDTGVVASRIFDDMLAEEIDSALRQAALAQLMEGNGVSADVRRLAAGFFGVRVSDWAFTAEYLQELSKSEIVRIGEEPDINIWSDKKVVAYWEQHHKGKALHSLPKEALIDAIMKSGADLAGRVPAEVLGARKG